MVEVLAGFCAGGCLGAGLLDGSGIAVVAGLDGWGVDGGGTAAAGAGGGAVGVGLGPPIFKDMVGGGGGASVG